MGAILYLAPVPAAQIIYPDCDLKTMSTFHSRFVRKQARWPPIFFQVFAKTNSLKKNIFEGKKSLIVEHFFFWKIVPYLVYLGQGEDFKLTTELSEKLQYSHNQAIRKWLNETILLIWIKEALCSR